MNYLAAIVSILIAEGAGLIGSLFTSKSISSWYPAINKPSWNPPNWIFGPVWITLYALMGWAAFLIWEQKNAPEAETALWLYGIQLVLNILWSVLFFGLKNPGLAFGEIILLLLFIALTTFLFWRLNPLAGALMFPYLAWVIFASCLNYAIWQLNK